MTGCAVEGCDRPARTRGWCGTHYARWWRKGHVDRVPAEPAFCTIDGCDAPQVGRGWCSKHWQRWRATGDPEGVAEVRQPRSDKGHPRLRGPGGTCAHCHNPLPADAAPARLFHPECRRAAENERRRVAEVREVPCQWCGEPVAVGGTRARFHPSCAVLHKRTRSRAKARGTAYATEKEVTLSGTVSAPRSRPCVECGRQVTTNGGGQVPQRCPTHAKAHRTAKERARDNGTTYEQEREREGGLPCDVCAGLVPLWRSGRRSGGTYCAACVKSGRSRRHSRIRATYGATATEATLIMAAKQCATCGEHFRHDRGGSPHVDHDHDTGHIRGVLCGGCNNALGRIHDNASTAVALAAYLLGHRETLRDNAGVLLSVAFPERMGER